MLPPSQIRKLLGRLLVLLGILQVLPLAVALAYGDGGPFREVPAFLGSIAVCTLGGALLRGRGAEDFGHISRREGFLVVTLSWTLLALVGGLPFALAEGVFLIDGAPASGILGGADLALAFDVYTHAVFEAISGFTTTGATVLTDIERLPKGLLFWRSLTHWLGGMGIVLLGIAILPSLGAGGYQLARAEVPGPTTDKLQPRIAETARLLWSVYLLLTVAQTLMLMVFGMGLFDALCHTFGTLATGGFSTKNASVAAYASPAIQWTITLFMAMAGVNFLLHYQALQGRSLRAYLRDGEWRMYAGILVLTSLALAVPLLGQGEGWGLERALRAASFQVVSITTTTGFATEDFDGWTSASRLVLVLLMFLGGCAGSTGGGLKQVRFMVLAKAVGRELRRLTRPSAVLSLKLDEKPVPDDVVASILALFCLYLALFALGAVLLATMLEVPGWAPGYRLETAVTASAACIGNIGPGLAGVGATQTYQFMPLAAKWLLVVLMVLGRLEVFSVVVLWMPDTWRR